MTVPHTEPRNGLGLTSLIIGLITVALGLGPAILAAFCIPGGIAGAVFGLSNLGRLRRGTATNKKATIAGIVLSVLGFVLGIIGAAIVNHAVHQLPSTY